MLNKLFRHLFAWSHLWVCLIAFSIMGLLLVLSFNISFLNPVARSLRDFSLSDLYYQIAWVSEEKPEESDMITLVDMTSLTRRGDIATCLQEINACSPAVVGVDIIFEGEKDDVQGNAALEQAFIDLPETVIAFKLTDYKYADAGFHGDVQSYFASYIPVMRGYSNVGDEHVGSTLRNLTIERSLQGKPTMSFAAQIATLYRDNALPPTQREDRLINFRHLDFPVVPCTEIRQNANLLRNRIVLLGTMTEEADMHFTPLGKIPGLRVQAYSIQTILEQHNIITLPTGWQVALSILICYLTTLLQYFTSRFIHARRSVIGIFLSNSCLYMRFVVFAWIGLITWGSFICYERYDLSIPMGIILVPVMLVGEARYIFIATVKAFSTLRFNPLRNSIYN